MERFQVISRRDHFALHSPLWGFDRDFAVIDTARCGEDGKPQRALEASGEEHGPLQLFTCDICGGEGVVPTGRWSHSVNSATVDPPFEITETCHECNGLGGWIATAEDDEEITGGRR